MFYNVKLSWTQPKEGSDQMQKVSKGFIVYAESVTEAELRVNQWTPSNYQDPVVEEVKKTTVVDLVENGQSEIFWTVKLLPEVDKPKPFQIIINGNEIEDLLKTIKTAYFDCQVLAIQKLSQIVDEDLSSQVIRKSETVEEGE